jgi:hypothetical protein
VNAISCRVVPRWALGTLLAQASDVGASCADINNRRIPVKQTKKIRTQIRTLASARTMSPLTQRDLLPIVGGSEPSTCANGGGIDCDGVLD